MPLGMTAVFAEDAAASDAPAKEASVEASEPAALLPEVLLEVTETDPAARPPEELCFSAPLLPPSRGWLNPLATAGLDLCREDMPARGGALPPRVAGVVALEDALPW